MTESHTDTREHPWHITLEQGLTAPIPAGARSALLLSHGSMSARFYSPRGRDEQTPHDQDEVYVIAHGEGTFVCGEDRVTFRLGDVLFVPAKVAHRFEDFSDDFAVWVMFWGPDGGEAG